jgi:hypothetical protein
MRDFRRRGDQSAWLSGIFDDLPHPPWAGKELLARQIVEPPVAASV